MRVYLDVCCLNRPVDDLSIGRHRLEAEAVLEILQRVSKGEWELAGSEAIDAELSLMPSSERRVRVMALAQLPSVMVMAEESERARAVKLLAIGFTYMDALHIACAESGRCDVFLTTDDAVLTKSRKHKDGIMVRVANPLDWIAEVTAP